MRRYYVAIARALALHLPCGQPSLVVKELETHVILEQTLHAVKNKMRSVENKGNIAYG
jgi:hypothetical protein